MASCKRDQFFAAHDRPCGFRMRRALADDLPFRGMIGIANANTHQKAVELRFGQRIGSVMLHRILRCDHHEGLLQRVGVAVDGDLQLIHGFQQRALCLGRSAIDLVRQKKIGEYRAVLELEFLGVCVVDRHPNHVAGEHVRGELDAMEAGPDRARKRLSQRGFSNPGHVLNQQVAARQQAGKGETQDFGLTADRHGKGGLDIR